VAPGAPLVFPVGAPVLRTRARLLGALGDGNHADGAVHLDALRRLGVGRDGHEPLDHEERSEDDDDASQY